MEGSRNVCFGREMISLKRMKKRKITMLAGVILCVIAGCLVKRMTAVYTQKENLEAVENFKGSRDEKLVILYCKQLGINYKNLSEEEFRWFIRILKKSKKMGTPISQWKKR